MQLPLLQWPLLSGAVLEGHPFKENADKSNLSSSGYANDDSIRPCEHLLHKCENLLEET